MAKSREKIQQFGFWDAEVSKPDHDAVCLWAYDNADFIFRNVWPEGFDHPWHKDEVHLGWDEKAHERIDLARDFANANPRPNPRVAKKTLEYVLKSYTGYQDKMERIVGYADLLLQTELPYIFPRYKPAARSGADEEFDGFELGWCKRLERARPYVEAPCILVEVKSAMPTVGELMRQVQLYRTAFSGKFVVVSPDERYAQILAEQGVTFIKYNP